MKNPNIIIKNITYLKNLNNNLFYLKKIISNKKASFKLMK